MNVSDATPKAISESSLGLFIEDILWGLIRKFIRGTLRNSSKKTRVTEVDRIGNFLGALAILTGRVASN